MDSVDFFSKNRLTIEGDIFTQEGILTMYSTDASVYKEKPIAVIRPKNEKDIREIIRFVRENKLSIIPRTAGTSLAGQVVGKGVVVDISKYLTKIIEINESEHWAKVQPGVVLDELNKETSKCGLFFGPETSTSNRCMIGGMTGNNSCGAHSLVYGSTRDHIIEIKAILSDGSEVVFKNLTKDEFIKKCSLQSLEGKIYRQLNEILSSQENQDEIKSQFPDPQIKRRNTGYALDLLLNTDIFTNTPEKFNVCKLLAGSEGTLAFFTEIKVNLVPLPPKEMALMCVHMNSLNDALYGNLIALKYNPASVELLDGTILELTKNNIEQSRNRFFLQGNPAALLIVEFTSDDKQKMLDTAKKLEEELLQQKFGYYFPVLFGNDIKRVWNLRKAGLGLLSNMPGDRKPVAVIEDTAVNPQVLPEYIAELKEILKTHSLNCVFFAHIATGELHTRPVLNLKDDADVETFRKLATQVAHLVKKYKGSLSGEHGDGRLRGEFIPIIVGDKNFELFRKIKQCWDPENIFNPGKIVDTPRMNTHFRFEPGGKVPEFKTFFDFSADMGLIRAIERCNGSADCRKSSKIGGVMCPSFMATKDENNSTRARANILREYLSNPEMVNPFGQREIYEVLDLCLSCKGCKSECPSSVDMAKLKAEFLQHYYDIHGVPFRSRMIANITKFNAMGAAVPGLYNFFITNQFFSGILKKVIGISPKRSIPKIYTQTLRKYIRNYVQSQQLKGRICLFIDEFTNYNDVEIGIKTILLFNKLGYEVIPAPVNESGRAYISKGLLKKAQKIAESNIDALAGKISEAFPLVGIEPSTILSFRDEYPELVDKNRQEIARQIAANSFMVDEFIAKEAGLGKISKELFVSDSKEILLHGHCQQKSIATTAATHKMLSLPENYKVKEIPSGCCGMAGSFGYEKEHYELSVKIGEMVLFPEVRNATEDVEIVAPGTSCRHHIKDGTGRLAKHPVEVLYDALKIKE